MNHNKRVLLIDDEEVITLGFSMVLKGPWVEVDCAHSLQEARQCIAENHYDAAVVDLRLSNSTAMEGFDCIRLLRSSQGHCKIIIVLTAYGDKRLREEAKALGVDLFFEKPMEPEKIREALDTLGIYKKPETPAIAGATRG